MSWKRDRVGKRPPEGSRRAREAGGTRAREWFSPARLALAFAVVAFGVYAPALEGVFVSDDLFYIVENPYVGPGDAPWLPLFDPTGEPTMLTGNYAPVHLVVHRVAWTVFGWKLWGHHALNVLLHVAASLLLVPLLRRSGVPELLSLFGGAFFLLHPANVEAVGWVFQLKTLLSQVLALAALLLFDRRPVLAAGAFSLALLTKATAAFALPVAAVLAWTRAVDGADRTAWRALAVWVVVLALFALAEFPAFAGVNPGVAPVHPDPLVQARSIVAFAMRYLVMAATSWSVSAYHEPDPALSWLDPWWLGGLAVLVLLGTRTVVALRARSEETAWWVWAAAAFVPVSQIFPFVYPMGDRYLYAILPGLLGGAFLAVGPLAAPRLASPRARRALVAVGVALLVGFGWHARARAKLWGTPALLQADAARHYPDGVNAHLLRANEAVVNGRPNEAVKELRGAVRPGYDRIDLILAYQPYAALRGRPSFDAVVEEMAGIWVDRFGERENLSQAELFTLGVAYRLRGEFEAARRTFERAAAMEGTRTGAVQAELRALDANELR
jgi:hypothetical protein